MYRVITVIAVLTALLAGGLAHAADQPPVVVLADTAEPFRLRGHLEILHDPAGTLTAADLAGSGDFQPRPAHAHERNYTNGAVWYRFSVLRPPGTPSEWVLAMGEPFIDDIRVYAPGLDGTIRETALGRRFANADLPLAARLHVAALDLPAGERSTVLVRLASHDEIQFDAALWRPTALIFDQVRTSTRVGMFLAALMCVVVSYFVLGSFLRDPPMIAYALYLLTTIMFGASHSGILPVVLPWLAAPATNIVAGLGVMGNVAAMVFMWDRVLNLRAVFPALHRLYTATAALAVACIALVPTSYFIHLVQPTFLATMAFTIISLGAAVRLLRQGRGNYLIHYYIVAFIPFLFFSVLHGAEVFLPDLLDILFVRQVGTLAMLAHITILGIALADRIARLQRDRISAGAELAATQAAMREHRNFISMLSHQIANPLAIITAATEVMELRGRCVADAAKIRGAAWRIRDLTSDLLAEARLDNLTTELAHTPLKLSAMLESLAQEHDPDGTRIRLDCDDRVTLAGDPMLLAVLFSNLLENAVKYSPASAPIRVHAKAGDGVARIAVTDSGPGIPAGELDKVFEKYYRCGAALDLPGTGLGLFLARQIAERHGGAIWVRSGAGDGTEFTVTLPLHRTAIPLPV